MPTTTAQDLRPHRAPSEMARTEVVHAIRGASSVWIWAQFGDAAGGFVSVIKQAALRALESVETVSWLPGSGPTGLRRVRARLSGSEVFLCEPDAV